MVNILCYKSKKLANGEPPLVIRICKDGKKKYQSLGVSVKAEHWDFVKNKPKSNCTNKELISKIILEKEAEFQKQILELKSEQKEFTAYSLLNSKKKRVLVISVSDYYIKLIRELKSNGKHGNAGIYNDSFRSLKTLHKIN